MDIAVKILMFDKKGKHTKTLSAGKIKKIQNIWNSFQLSKEISNGWKPLYI